MSSVTDIAEEVITNPDSISYYKTIVKHIFITLGVVYTFGKMLGHIKTDYGRNITAILTLFGLTILYSLDLQLPKDQIMIIVMGIDVMRLIKDVFDMTMISMVFYVSVCWKFYTRMDSLLDRFLSPDQKETHIYKTKPPKNKE